MKTKVKDLLPIGSVIRLKKGTKCLVIMGIKQKDMISGNTYDYIAVPYPEGFISNDTVFFCTHDKIEEVLFKGFSNKEREDFIENLTEYYKNNKE